MGGWGAYGVQLFFVISGFLIVNSYEKYARENLGKFFINKMIKILPLYYCVITYYFIVHKVYIRDVPADPTGYGWLRYLFLLNGVLPSTDTYFWDNLGITWTIPSFVCAYLCLPFVLKWVKSFYSSVIVAVGSYLLVEFVLNHVAKGWFSALGNMPVFMAGVVVYYCFREKKQKITFVGLGCLLALQLLRNEGVLSFLPQFPQYVFLTCLFMLLIITTEKMQIKNAVMLKILTLSDQYSYTFYLGHGIVFIHILDRFNLHHYRPLVAIFGSLIVTCIINKFVETPIQQKLSEYIQKLESRLSSGNIRSIVK